MKYKVGYNDMLEPVEFDWESFKDESKKIAVHCKNKKEAEDFCRQMHEHGMTWCDGECYLEDTYWEEYEEDMCYSSDGTYADIDFHEFQKYTILEWSDYMNTEKKEFTLSDIKDGMVVEVRSGFMYVEIGERLVRETGWNALAYYLSNMLEKDKDCDELDIVAVYEMNIENVYLLGDMFKSENLIPVWKREEKKTVKMTVEEMKKKLSEIMNVEIVEG